MVKPGTMPQSLILAIWEAAAGRLQVPGQSGQSSEILLKNKK